MMTTEREVGQDWVEAVLWAEPRTAIERDELEMHTRGLNREGVSLIRLLSDGVIVALLVRIRRDAVHLLTLLNTTLKRDYRFGHVEMSLNPIVLDVIRNLSENTQSEYFPLGPCSLCDSEDPMSGHYWLTGPNGERTMSEKLYCPVCAKAICTEPVLRTMAGPAVV